VSDAGPDVDPLAAPLGTIVVHELQHWQTSSIQPSPTFLPYIDATFTSPSVSVAGASCISTHPTMQCGYPPTCNFLPPVVGAGTLTVAGDLFGGGVDLVETDGAPSYNFQGKQTTKSLTAGDVLTASASGDEVPGFTAQLTVPANITLIAPQEPYVLPSGQDLTFTWSGGESGAFVSVAFNAPLPVAAFCTFDATAGTGTIPYAALGGFTGTTHAAVMVIRDEKTWVGNYAIDFQIQRTQMIELTIE